MSSMDSELIRILTKAVEDLGLAWSAPEEPTHGLLDEWYLKGCCQHSSRQQPPLLLPAVHKELTRTWHAPYSACVNPSTSAALTTVDGAEGGGYRKLPVWKRRLLRICAFHRPWG